MRVRSYTRLLAGAIGSLGPAADARDDELHGRFGFARRLPNARPSKKLDARLARVRRFGVRTKRLTPTTFDPRQQVVIKIHYYGHGGGPAAAGALKAHGAYLERGGAQTPLQTEALVSHAPYLEGDGETKRRGRFYDWVEAEIDGRARLAVWAREDKRHFRIIVAPENGAWLGDLKAYTRELMARSEILLGTRLEWVAVDHHDTASPHTHIVLRGRRANGRELILPRAFVRRGMREAARDLATERLGERSRLTERRALDRETRAHRWTRLDSMIDLLLDDRRALPLSELDRRLHSTVRGPVRRRLKELERLGLVRRSANELVLFDGQWRERLRELGIRLDIAKSRLRIQQKALARTRGLDIDL